MVELADGLLSRNKVRRGGTLVSTRVSEIFASVYISRGVYSRSEPSRSSSIPMEPWGYLLA